jgi:hypothetical protein
MIGDYWTEMDEDKKTIIVRHQARVIAKRGGAKNDISAGNRIVVHVDYRVNNCNGLRFGSGELLRNRTSDHYNC